MLWLMSLYNAHTKPYEPFDHSQTQSHVEDLDEICAGLLPVNGYDYAQMLWSFHNDHTLPSQIPFLQYNNFHWAPIIDPNSFALYHTLEIESRIKKGIERNLP